MNDTSLVFITIFLLFFFWLYIKSIYSKKEGKIKHSF